MSVDLLRHPPADMADGWPMTLEVYRELEASDDRKWEYFAGRAFPWTGYELDPLEGMVGASLAHVRIQRNAYESLGLSARAAGCEVWPSDVRFVYDMPTNRYYYADAMVSCEPAVEIDGAASLTAPCVVVEVLSRSNQRGRGRLLFADKLHRYLNTPAIQSLLLIEQDRRLVHVYERLPDGSMAGPREVTDGAIQLACLAASVSIDVLYGGL